MNETQLALARQVHYAFLPQAYADENLDVTVTTEPHQDLGGDYCGIVPLTDGRVALTMCDATGHGPAAALFAARINTYVLSRVALVEWPCQLVDSLNRFLYERMHSANMHATFCAVIVDPREGTWDFAGAGHPPALHYRAKTQDTVLVPSQTTMVGAFDALPMPCGTTRSRTAEGDRILLFTDGLVDGRDAAGEPYGLDHLQASVVSNAHLEGEAFNEALFESARSHADGVLGDDALLLTVRYREPKGA